MAFPKVKREGRRRVQTTWFESLDCHLELLQTASWLYNEANYYLKTIYLYNQYVYWLSLEPETKAEKDKYQFIEMTHPELCKVQIKRPGLGESYLKQTDEDGTEHKAWLAHGLDRLFQGRDNYKALPAAVSQQVLQQLDRDWSSFEKATRSYWKDSSKFKGMPKPPGYKKRGKSAKVIFTKGNFSIETVPDSSTVWLHFPERAGIPPVRIKPQDGELQQIDLKKDGDRFCCECIYFLPNPETIHQRNELPKRLVTIDLGIDNLLTLLDDAALQDRAKACIIDGRMLKSRNQRFNKRLAELQSKLPEGQKSSHQIRRLFAKRNRWMLDYIHKVTRLVADYCYENDVTQANVGYNPGWKQDVELGKTLNQGFVQIPFLSLVQQLKYKLFDRGIALVQSEESYTSKTDHLVQEPMKHIEAKDRLGRRVHHCFGPQPEPTSMRTWLGASDTGENVKVKAGSKGSG